MHTCTTHTHTSLNLACFSTSNLALVRGRDKTTLTMCDAVVVATDGVAGEGVGSAEAVVEGGLAIVFSAVWETARYVILFLCLCLCLCLSCSFFLSLCLSVCVSVCACVLCLCIYQR
jgi:hypothetical protein